MAENEPLKNNGENTEPEILVNEYGSTIDDAVVIDEPDRTVLLTEDETIVVAKEPAMPITPTNRARKVYGGMWGPIEIATFGVSLLVVLAAILFWLFIVGPSSAQLEENRAERDSLEADLKAANAKYGKITDTETQVAKLVTSVDDFESRFLLAATNGRTSLYQRLNGLIGAYGLVNTNGPAYSPLETLDITEQNQTDAERGRAKYRSLFPGVYVTMTVEGPYANLRRFIREVETGNEFVVISSVELAPSESQAPRDRGQDGGEPITTINPVTGMPEQIMPPPQSARPRGRSQGERVALRIEMAAYFQRPERALPLTDAPQQ
jgi:hypothetical protein